MVWLRKMPQSPCATAGQSFRVPAQDLVLVETDQGVPVCSMGLCGRGKVIAWGLKDLYRMREFERAAVMDRWLDSWVGEFETPLLPVAADNPGMERLYPEFNPTFLQTLASECGGTYLTLADAKPFLRNLVPDRVEIVRRADTYRVGGHPLLFFVVVFMATIHWILRKLSGLAI